MTWLPLQMPSTTSELLHKSIQKLENVKGICGNEDGAKHKHIISPPPREPPSQASEMWEGKAGSWRLFRQVPRIQEACRNLHFRVHFEPWGPWPAVGQLWHPLYLRVASRTYFLAGRAAWPGCWLQHAHLSRPLCHHRHSQRLSRPLFPPSL